MTYEFEGKTEKDAIEKAAQELGLEQSDFDVEILEVQKKSLFKAGYVKIRVYTDDNRKIAEEDEYSKKTFNSNEKNSEKNLSELYGEKSEKSEKSDPLPKDEFEKKLLEFVSTVISKMGYDIKTEILFREENKIGIKLISENSPILIGRKGKNLDALQLLANVYAGRLGNEKIRIILDSENYRIRREESLIRLAYQTADKVRSTKHSILLDPMNPFERRLIHTTINDIPDIDTKSEGDGLYKQVCVFYKEA